jgi:hypothetical protein
MKRQRRKAKAMRRLSVRTVVAFKIANRRGYATVCRNHLTEGASIVRAYARLVKACRRSGYDLPDDRLPRLRSV